MRRPLLLVVIAALAIVSIAIAAYGALWGADNIIFWLGMIGLALSTLTAWRTAAPIS